MNIRPLTTKILKRMAGTALAVIGAFLFLASLLYLPPVQTLIKNRAAALISQETGMCVTIGKVRLSFPLDLLVGDIVATQDADTVVAAGQLLIDIRLLPLFSGKVDINGFELRQAKLNSRDLISDTRIEGVFNLLAIDKPAVCDLKANSIDLNRIRFSNADISVTLSDTARKDTTPSEPSPWKIKLGEARLHNTRIHLQMPGDSMRLNADIQRLRLCDALIDLRSETFKVGDIDLASRNVAYHLPYEPKRPATGANPHPLDFNHLGFDVLSLKAKDFRYAGQSLDIKLHKFALKEKSGLTLNELSADIHYDTACLTVNNANLRTPGSWLEADLRLPFSAIDTQGHGSMEAKIKGAISKADISILTSNSFDDLLARCPNKSLGIQARAEGSLSDLTIDYCNLSMPQSIDLRLHGTVRQLLYDKKRNGQIHYATTLKDVRFANNLIPHGLRQTIRIPNNIQVGGDISFSGSTYTLTRNTVYHGGGSMAFSGSFSARSMSYAGRLQANRFPLHAFMPGMNLSPLTATFNIKGHGTDFMSGGTNVTARGAIASFAYDGIPLDGVSLDADLKGTQAHAVLLSDNRWLKANLNITAAKDGHETSVALNGNIDQFSLNLGKTLKPGEDPTDLTLIMGIDLQARFNDKTNAVAVAGTIDPLNAITSSMGFPGGSLQIDFFTDDHSTNARLSSGDMAIQLNSPESVSGIISGYSECAALLSEQFAEARLNADTLRTLLPNLDLTVRATRNNPVQQFLAMQGYAFDSLYAHVNTGKDSGLNADIDLRSFKAGAVLLEHSSVKIVQDKEHLALNASVKNSKRSNPNRFTAVINGEMLGDGFSVLADFVDAKGKRGLNIGTRASFSPQGDMTFSLIPEVSTIAYRQFKVNKNNFITIDHNNFITADVSLLADDNTALKLFSMPADSTDRHDLTLSIGHLNLRDLSSVIPFMPHMAGFLTGDIHMVKEYSVFTAVAALETENFEYEGTTIGTLGTELFYMPEDNGHYVVARILNEDKEIAVLDGHYNGDETGNLNASLTLNHMPCQLFNPLMGNDGTLGLSGDLDGEVNVEGTLNTLKFNGQITPDSVHAYSELYGFDLAMENKTIDIVDSRIRFNDMALYSKGDNPLYINGDIDFNDLGNMVIDLKVKADDYEIINSRKTKKSMVFGNVFIDLDATIKGKNGLIILKGNMDILENTNVTYVMTDTPLQVEDQFNGLVEFTNFTEPQDEEQETPPVSGTFINLKVNIDELARLHCELSADGKSYVDCKGGGNLSLRIFPSGETALLGRFNINSGEMKYTLPFIPLKTFAFTDGSHVTFNGDPSNPTLNITAMENTKASVSDDNGATRMVAFQVGVAITRQLSDMGLEFLIEAPEDLEVQNELATMSSETRNRLAITMLATGMYASTNNKSGFKATNALNAFLESEIQNIAGNTLKSVDFSVGIEGNTTSTGETQTDYTFQFSKKLWNDRVTIILGGKVSTGNTEDNSSAQSFIDNISLEYRLDRNNSRYLRLFYDNDNYDPLEGRYSSGGAGYILRRKTNSFGELLILGTKKK